MKKNQIIYMMCATALLSSCHIYKAYDRPETIDTSGLYRDPVSVTDTLAADTTNMGNLSWKEVFRDPKLQALIEEGLANNVDMQAAVLRVEEAKTLLTAARLSFLPSLNLAPQGSLTTMGGSSYAKAYTLPAAANWEVDLFGKLLNASRDQKAIYLQSQYSQQAVRSQLIGGIANTYWPERFQLEYTGSDNQKHRPVMIHRAPFGSMERFVAVLLEHTAGRFPLWLAPDQVVVLPISEKFNDYAYRVADTLAQADIRALVDDRNEKIGKKIRDNELKRIPYMLIVGEKEAEKDEVSVRKQGEGDKGTMKITTFAENLAQEVEASINQ